MILPSKPANMDKKNLPIDLLICGGVALIASFLPYASISLPKELAAFGAALVPNSPNAWSFGLTLKIFPQILPVFAIIAIAVFAMLRAQNIWKAPHGLSLGLSIYALAHMVLTTLSLFAQDHVGPGIGSLLILAGAGYVFYLVVIAKKPMGLMMQTQGVAAPQPQAPPEEPKSGE